LLGVVLLGVPVYAAFVLYAGFREIHQSLATFHWSAFVAALALSSTNYLLRYLKWEYYLGRLEIRGIGKLDSLLVFLSGFVLTVSPGKVGEVFKSVVLKRTHGVPLSQTAPIIVGERLTDVIAVIVLIALGSAGFSGGLSWAAAGTAFVVIGLAMILWDRPTRAVLGWLEQRRRLSRMVPSLRTALGVLRQISTPSALVVPVLLSVVGWGCEGFSLYLLLGGFGAFAPISLSVFFYSTASLAGALIPVPGGLGVVEAMIQEQLVHLAQVPHAAATSSMILVRVATLWWAVLVGFAALGLLRLKHPSLRGIEPSALASTPAPSPEP
jgi:uncharacterized protein (TIRG00374 family)